MWSYILNPTNNQKFHVNSQNGQSLLRNYIYQLRLQGGSDQGYDSDPGGVEFVNELQFDSSHNLQGQNVSEFDHAKQALNRRREAVHHLFSDLNMPHTHDSTLFKQVLNPLNLLYSHEETKGMNLHLLAAASLLITSKIIEPAVCVFKHEVIKSLKSMIHSKTELTNNQILKKLNKNVIFVTNFLKSEKYLSNESLNKIKNNTISKYFYRIQQIFISFTPENKSIRDLGYELTEYIENSGNMNNIFQYGILASIFNIIFKLTGKPELEPNKLFKYFKETNYGTKSYIKKTETKLLKHLKKDFLEIGEKSIWDQFMTTNPPDILNKFTEILKNQINPKYLIVHDQEEEVDFEIKPYKSIQSNAEKIPKHISIDNVMNVEELKIYIKEGASPIKQKSPGKKPTGKKTAKGQKGKFKHGEADSADTIRQKLEAAKKAKEAREAAKTAEKRARDEARIKKMNEIFGPGTLDDAW